MKLLHKTIAIFFLMTCTVLGQQSDFSIGFIRSGNKLLAPTTDAAGSGYPMVSDGSGNLSFGAATINNGVFSGTMTLGGTSITWPADAAGVLTSDGAGGYSWGAAGGGDVTKVGTPVDNQVAVWTGDGTVEGDVDLVFDGANLGIGVTPTVPLDVKTTGSTLARFFHDAATGFLLNLQNTEGEWAFGVNSLEDFVIRDVTGGNIDIFRVEGGAALDMLRIASNDRVGIGIASPSQRLHVGDTAGTGVLIRVENDTSHWDFGIDSGEDFALRDGAATTIFEVQDGAPASSLFIESTGDVGIGSGTPDFQLDVGGTIGIVEQAAADADAAGKGQVWVKNTVPCELWFTDDSGVDYQLGLGGVTKVGTPVDNQVGIWTGDGTIEGDTAFTFDTATDTLTLAASANLNFGAVNIIDDTAGSTTLANIDAIDATTESTIEAAIDTLANLTSATSLSITESQISDLQSYLLNVIQDTTPQLGGQLDINGQAIGDGTFELLTFVETASAVNQLTVTNAATAGDPSLTATGDDANIDLVLDGKGTGTVKTLSSDFDVTGNIAVSGTVDGRDVAADGTKLDGVEALADVTDTANVTAAGALMDSEVDADLKTLALPANTTISAFGATVIDDATAAAARTTLDVDQAGTDNSTDVTLAGTPDYITISGQIITRNQIDLATDITGATPIANGGTGQTAQTAAFDALAPTTTKGDVIVFNGTDNVRVPVGTDTQVLTADSAEASGVKWTTAAGGGNVTKVGTPVDNQVGVWTGDGTIEGDVDLIFDGTNLGIGGTATYPLHVSATDTDTTGLNYLMRGAFTLNPASANTATNTGLFLTVTTDAAETETFTDLFGVLFQVDYDSTGNLTNARGIQGTVNNDDTATIAGARGSYGLVRNNAGGTITNAEGATSAIENTSTGTITAGYGFRSIAPVNSGGGTFTNYYSFYADNPTAAATNYGMWTGGGRHYFNQAGTDNDFRYESVADPFALVVRASVDNVGVGDASPDGKLDVFSDSVSKIAVIIDSVASHTADKLLIRENGGSADFVVDGAGSVGVGIAAPDFTVDIAGTLALTEQAAADADVATKGQIWVRTATPNELWFTDDAGTDHQLGVGITADSTDTLTNKTFDANGTGNSLSNVDVADLANGTDGELITWSATGTPATVAVGTSGHVLTSNGTGAAPTFQAAPGGANYGEISVEGNATATTISSASTDFSNAVQVLVFDTNGVSSGTTPDHTNDHITVDTADTYTVTATISFGGGNGDEISAAIFINNKATQITPRTTRTISSATAVGNMVVTGLATLSATDTVELWIQNESDASNVTVEDCTLTLMN